MNVYKMLQARPHPNWFLLKLPTGKWAALWYQGLGLYDEAIEAGDYENTCAFIGTKREALEYIRQDAAADDEPF